MQGGMCRLPIPPFPTGVMRGRFHPDDGQLYACGMFAWAGNQTAPGGFYRVRATGKPMFLPTGLHATKNGVANHVHRPDRPRLRLRPVALFRENMVAQADGELRLGALRREAASRLRGVIVRGRPHGLPRPPRHPADMGNGDPLPAQRLARRALRGNDSQHDPPSIGS